MNEIIFIVKESPEGGFEARALGFSIFVEGDTYDEMKENIRDAIHCHFEKDIPKVGCLVFVMYLISASKQISNLIITLQNKNATRQSLFGNQNIRYGIQWININIIITTEIFQRCSYSFG
jgi:hypothetical protein